MGFSEFLGPKMFPFSPLDDDLFGKMGYIALGLLATGNISRRTLIEGCSLYFICQPRDYTGV